MIKLFKDKKQKKEEEVIAKPVKYIVYTEPFTQDGSYFAWKTLFESKLFHEVEDARKYAEDNSKYSPMIVGEIKMMYKYKRNPVVEILND